jgi:dTDP-glucose 4,6-dehydratase
MRNLDLARRVCAYLGVADSQISFVPDRPVHDLAYGLDWSRLEALGWAPSTTFADGLAITLAWYRDHQDWVGEVLAGTPA